VKSQDQNHHDLWEMYVVVLKNVGLRSKLSALSGDDEKQFILKYVQEQQIIRLLKLIIITPVIQQRTTYKS
jgi:hypothetical protein